MDTKKHDHASPINVLINFNEFIKKIVNLQDIIFEKLPKMSYQ